MLSKQNDLVQSELQNRLFVFAGMIQTEKAFGFVTIANLVELTGVKAANMKDLVTYLKTASGGVIYYHTHHFLKQHQFLSPEPPNDFAYWASNVLNEERLGEQLASIDTVRFTSLQALQQKIVDVIERFLAVSKSQRYAPPGEEFHFMRSKTFVLPTPYKARNLREFYDCLEKISVASLYYHVFESRLRLPDDAKETNDFSLWLEKELKEIDLAKAIKKLDPYTHTLDGLRKHITRLVKKRLDAQTPQGGQQKEPVYAA